MPASYPNIQRRLKAFDFKGLFTQELMWNNYTGRELSIPMDGVTYPLAPVAEQRGMAVYVCVPPSGVPLPNYATRRKIDTQVSKTAREHIVIFHDALRTTQIWQWVKRESGKPSACREQIFYANQTGDALIQKIQGIAFSLEEVDSLSIVEVTSRVGTVFDVEKVTKKFYELFKKEHDTFQKFVRGIPDEELQAWYVSVMLNRLMFIYFVQKKGFLDNNQNYLENKLVESKRRSKDKFYREFLCPLFFEGFAKQQRSQRAIQLLGNIPYLNGGLFLKHHIEDLYGERIEISDAAFEKIFHFFEEYDWHLDDRPTRKGNEVNPDVLGYVFEKYINQKEMGAYYSKEDITEYIGKNTIIPVVFDITRRACRVAFEGEQSIWRLLKTDPDRYIHAAVLHGIGRRLPPEIAAGILDAQKRGEWNKPAPSEYALPTETWREVVLRRTRCEQAREKLAAGEILSIKDMITYNLDIRRFAEEAIATCEGPELLRAFRNAIWNVSVLDPTCGSGAFLFAALNILERLYDTCLVRMQAFVDDLERTDSKHRPEKFSDFRQILDEMNDKARHPSPRYFVLKSIILNNLYGVDIMEEATEICKLRLFLKLVAQVNPGERIEPLPDIDFNIRAGNTLVGFATEGELDRVLHTKLDFDSKKQDIKERAELTELAFQRFREIQVEQGMGPDDFSKAKGELQQRLSALRNELDGHLAGDYGIRKDDKEGFEAWRSSHHPFHWFVEFYGIMRNGGFEVIIGNPPYVEYSKVRGQYTIKSYSTEKCSNLYNYVSERSTHLLKSAGWLGFIIPLGAFSTDRMEPFQNFVYSHYQTLHLSFFSGDAHPSVLFEGVKYRLAITIGQRETVKTASVFTSSYLRWYADERPNLFAKISYVRCEFDKGYLRFAKLGVPQAVSCLQRLLSKKRELGLLFVKRGAGILHYHRSPVFWIRAMDFEPYFKSPTRNRSDDHLRDIFLVDTLTASSASAILNSTLFYFWFCTQGNCRDVAGPDVTGFPVGELTPDVKRNLNQACTLLMEDLRNHSRRRVYHYEKSGRVEYDEFYPKLSKTLIDKIDSILASHYGFTDFDLDFILNYDIKYRMGRDSIDDNNEDLELDGEN
jgi:hypothetical protein